ncbi:NTE family protein [Andreprevotia lacus DSM 23236]|jgi:NTE family protein|uniref:NTE family protein n=1 Tax=Andreprevotia lacus DSM 23236 TaxID=1121001 RepID=A0A1W1XMG1_9NEIS|nr:patatin-like phospholipase family protein [Andreprevotia lacus]SMC25062.1 NTE family protein [Andreprevotia lacus DSM 23236]
MADNVQHKQAPVGLILSGGGARAAYQVGVLLAVARLLPRRGVNPFPIICGTSAGAINAAALAAGATDFKRSVFKLVHAWGALTPDRVYRAGLLQLFGRAGHWVLSLLIGGMGRYNPRSFLDNAPLRELLGEMIDLAGIGQSVEQGSLVALSITASGYTSGESVSFFQGDPALDGWRRAKRIGVPVEIEMDHLMASSAIPLVFPAVHIRREYFGDGSVRQIAPISPAIHLGARKLLVVGVAPQDEHGANRQRTDAYPSLAQVAGHLMNSVFLDSLETDLERLTRINRTLSKLPNDGASQLELQPIEVLSIAPSQPLERLSIPHKSTFPPGLRFLLSGLGAFRRQGSVVASYLMFHGEYTRALIQLGYKDAMAQRQALETFLGLSPQARPAGDEAATIAVD